MIYVMLLPNLIAILFPVLFADDAKFYSHIHNLNTAGTMQRCLDSVLHRDITWQLKLSVSKCKVVVIFNDIFSSKYKLGVFCLPI